MLPLVTAALGIITDRNSTDYWYQSKALPAQTVCPSLTVSFHTLSLQNRWDPYQPLWLLVCVLTWTSTSFSYLRLTLREF